jgi:hypothetical protein
MSRLNLVVNFLNTLNSKPVKEAFDYLSVIMEELENKNDPDQIEMEIVDAAYQVIEKLSLLQSAMRQYKNSETPLTGKTLSDLYDDNKGRGTSTLFDD